jgi:hypothetical protein
MLPQVVRLTSLDVYRDGGSVSVSFDARDGSEYTLFFQVDLRAARGDEPTYGEALLRKATRTEYVSPVTGGSSPDWRRESVGITWGEARDLLEVLQPHARHLSSSSRSKFEYMCDVAARDGGEQPTRP